MSSGLIQLINSQTDNAAPGTGILLLLKSAKEQFGENIPLALSEYALGTQNGLFGSYPDLSDVAPCAVFVGVFACIWLAHSFIFFKNYSRGHVFWLSLAFSFYSLMRWVGFALRIVWAKDATKVETGIASSMFLILPTIFLASFNLILAQRLFTWRHPDLGSRQMFWNFMLTVYAVVIVLVIITIVAAAVPYDFFLSEAHYNTCKIIVRVTSVSVCLYSILAIQLVILAFQFKPTQKDLDCFEYQPWWIESFSPFYFVEKGAAQKAAASFMRRSHDHRHSVRTIASSKSAFKQVQSSIHDQSSLTHNMSIFIVAITSVIILVGAVLRSITVIEGRTYATENAIYKPVVMYICWGAFETIVNVIYLVGRVDLRFYRPCRLTKEVREVVTANQSIYGSDEEQGAGSIDSSAEDVFKPEHHHVEKI